MGMRSKLLVTSLSALTTAAVLTPAAVAVPAASAASATPALSGRQIRQMSLAELRRHYPRVRLAVRNSKVDGAGGYQGQHRCQRGNRPGTVAMRDLLKRTYDRRITIGLSRGCGGGTSEHYDGRALDWMVNSNNPRRAAQGDAFVRFLTMRDRNGVVGAYAKRLGVMYIIWRGRMWRTYAPGWRDYNGCKNRNYDSTSCHYDHVHISLTWKGAYKRTSWYRR